MLISIKDNYYVNKVINKDLTPVLLCSKIFPKMKKELLFMTAAFLLLVSCSKESLTENVEPLKVSNLTTVTTNDLLGSWTLSKMTADTFVDLNDDGTSSTNLLNETTCFNNMDITFHSDGTFISHNATMTFEAGTDSNEFSCLGDREDSGTWEISDNNLILNLVVKGNSYTHKKAIKLGENTFSFDVSKIESELYVTDPGNTQASEIRVLALEYTRN